MTLDLEKKLLGQWNALVRRARIGREHKAAALTVSSYANPDGTGIRLSVARYAVDLEVSYSTARRYLRWLREVGLLELTRAGSRRKGTASEYRLILHPDVMEHLDVPTPSRIKELADEMREANRSGVRGRAAKAKAPVQRSSKVSAETGSSEGPEGALLRSSRVSAKDQLQRSNGPSFALTQMTHTPFRTHLSVEDQPSRADDEDLRTDLALSGAPAETAPSPTKCSHGLSAAARADGRPACALCRVAEDQAAGIARPGVRRPPDPPPPARLAPVIPLRSEIS